jgi:hypothetical protein
MSKHECEQTRSLMINVIEDGLSILEKQRLDQHLDHCQDCRHHFAELWELKAISTQWKDIPVPAWDRRQNLFEAPSFLPGFQYLSGFASVLVLVLVLTSAEISTKDGFSINFGGNYVSRSELTQRLKSIESDQRDYLQTSVQKLTDQQVTTSQLLMKSMLTTSRVERREDLQQVFALVDEAQGQQLQLTNDSLRVLISYQLEDRRNINHLNQALFEGNLKGREL